MRNAAWQVLFLLPSSRLHMPAGLCMRERKEAEAQRGSERVPRVLEVLEAPAATGRREGAGKIRCWMTKYRRGWMTEEQLWKPIGCGNDRLEC